MSANPIPRFRDRQITFTTGAVGQPLDVPSYDPVNYHQAISRPDGMPAITVDGQLFLPPDASGPLACVIVAPGSLGVADSHLKHARTVTALGLAAFVLDSFGVRGVTTTVANQTQFSFAASAVDVLSAWKVLAAHPAIDAARIGAQGHSRGGSAVLTAATRTFADAIAGAGRGLAGVYAAYPWSGHQFLSPGVGRTAVRVIHGDADEWCSPMQVQGHVQAIRLTGGHVSMKMVEDAHHSFDRGAPLIDIPEARISPGAPTTYIADDGAFLHPLADTPDPGLTDGDLMRYGGHRRKGAHIGGTDQTAALFTRDMTAFWRATLD